MFFIGATVADTRNMSNSTKTEMVKCYRFRPSALALKILDWSLGAVAVASRDLQWNVNYVPIEAYRLSMMYSCG